MEEEQEGNVLDNHKIRMVFKRNFKGEKGWELSVKGNTKEEIDKLIQDAKAILEREGF